MMNCGLCKGDMVERLVTHTEDLGSHVVVIRNVPATVCEVCGNIWFSGTVISHIESIVDRFESASMAGVSVVEYDSRVA